jgi:predicted TIM-barrel fold metal-dependent hydrolase
MEEDSVMDYPISTTTRVFPPLIVDVGNQGDHDMEQLAKRVEQLDKTTQKIQMDVAVLAARSESFATKADIESVRTEQGVMRLEIMAELGQLENRIDKKFDRIEEKFDAKFDKVDEKFERMENKFDRKFAQLNDRLTWSIMVPALLAVLAWFVKTAVLKI